jgi:hypothetical protein
MRKRTIEYIGHYSDTIKKEYLFLGVSNRSKSDAIRHAGNFLSALHVYEYRVPKRIRKVLEKRFGDFGKSKGLANEIINEEARRIKKENTLKEIVSHKGEN